MPELSDNLNDDARDALMQARLEKSYMKDYDGSRRRYADEVSTSEALRKRRNEWLATRNGHASIN
jgi:hypothetical protein